MLTILWQTKHIIIAQTTAGLAHLPKANDYGFNVGLHVGDDASTVLQHRATLLTALQPYGVTELAWVNQVHGNHVASYNQPSLLLTDADSLVSDKAQAGLCIMTADCVPIALFTGDGQKIACIHAGHQGLSNGVIAHTVAKMPKVHLSAYIGACISGAHYEIPETLATSIVKACVDGNLNDATIHQAISPQGDGKVLLDVALIARQQLQKLGVAVLNEQVACTYRGDYHSYRRAFHHKDCAGRMAMVIARTT